MAHNPEALLESARTSGALLPEALDRLEAWLTAPQYAADRALVEAISEIVDAGDFSALNDAFHTVVPFGTGGRRGPMGPGPNRINSRTIGESAQGLAAYLRARGAEAGAGVVIAHDTRHRSRQFAEETAAIIAGNGFAAHPFDGPRPTPMLSFAVRHLRAAAGIVISASHNPPSDNGFKVFGPDGAQPAPPDDTELVRAVEAASALSRLDLDDARARGLLRRVGPEVETAYLDEVAALALAPEARGLHVVYSPLHGTGTTNVLPVLERAGFRVTLVDDQAAPDGSFPNVPRHSPNPEEPAALEAGIALAREEDADLVLASDPDADRLGAAAAGPDGWRALTGNEIGALLCSFICEQLHSRGELPAEGFVVKTGVTTDLICAIARDYGLRCVGDLLVGFKWIAKEIARDPGAFIFGGEESHGFVRGAFVRDKDSAIAALHLAECAATLKARGRTLFDGLEALHGRYGVHSERLSSIAREGARGQAQIQRLMSSLRAEPPPAIGRHRIVEVIDRSDGTVRDPATGAIRRTLRGARGDMLVFLLSHDGKTRLTVRPSGTEPKVKVYAAAYNPPSAEPDRGSVGAKARRMVEDFHAFAESRMR